MRSLNILLIILAVPSFAFADTLIVLIDYPTIQLALDASSNGDTIIVKPGTYMENIDFNGKTIPVMSEQGPEVSVIDGSQSGSVVMIQNNSVLDGFTITNGLASQGGGIYSYDDGGATIQNNIIVENSADFGAGIAINGSAIITDNEISQNTAIVSGGGIKAWNSFIANNIIMMNNAVAGGGISDDDSTIINNTILKNHAFEGGGGIACSSSSVINNIISWNSTGPQGCGGGIFWCNSNVIPFPLPDIINCVIYGNSSRMGGGIYYYGLAWSDKGIINTILWNNKAVLGPEIYVGSNIFGLNISFSDIKGGKASVYGSPDWGPGIIDADPLFVDQVNEDFQLTLTSPCIDAGDNNAPSLPAIDFEGDPSIFQGNGNGVCLVGSPPQGAVVNMGVDEYCLLKRKGFK